MVYEETKLTLLADELAENLKNRKDFFKPYTVVVPNKKMAQYFKAYWLKQENDVLMNVIFKSFNEVMQTIFDCKFVNQAILKFLILEYIENHKIPYIEEYINDDIRKYDLVNELARLFIDYNEDCFDINGWQNDIYENVIKKANEKGYFFLNQKMENEEIHISNMCFFGFSKLSKIQEEFIKIIKGNNDIYILKKNDNKKVKVFSAPSKLREIEIVHAIICKKLNEEKDIKYADFLVLASNMSEYKTTIKRVFEQDNIQFPCIPYSCCKINPTNNNSLFVLNLLVQIANKKYFTRNDFFEIINNDLTRTIRNISKEEIEDWMKAIIDLNIYRQTNFFDSWDYIRKRLLLSIIVEVNDVDENIVNLDNGDYIPYKGIMMDNESIIKFIKVVDDLKEWIHYVEMNVEIGKDDIISLKEKLGKWLSLSSIDELDICFRKICSLLNNLNYWFLENKKISFTLLMNFILDELKKNKINQKELFTSGITFTDFDEKCILSAKYVFLIGANSDSLPIKKVSSELDLRSKNDEEDLNSLYLQLQNAENEFYISYINRDLESDGELYPSSFINDLKIEKKQIKEYSLDRELKWEDLFTIREYRNKTHYEGLFKEDNENSIKVEKFIIEEIKKIKLSSMAKFLKEPFSQKVRMIFGNDYDNEKDIVDEYESFDLNNFNNHDIKILIIKELLNNRTNVEEIKAKLILENKLPNLSLDYYDDIFNKVYKESEILFNFMNNYGQFEFIKLSDLTIDSWTLICDFEMFRNINGNEHNYFDIPYSNSDSYALSHLLKLYVFTLMDIASKKDNVDYKININYGNTKSNCNFILNSKLAEQYLKNIYLAMNNFDDYYALPASNINKKEMYLELSKFVESLNNDSDWKYFDSKNMFDYYTQLGYDKENFKEEFENNINDFKELVKPLLGEKEGK